MDGALKKGVVLLLVLFIGWFLFTDPSGLAGLSKELGTGLWDLLVTLFEKMSTFLTSILG